MLEFLLLLSSGNENVGLKQPVFTLGFVDAVLLELNHWNKARRCDVCHENKKKVAVSNRELPGLTLTSTEHHEEIYQQYVVEKSAYEGQQQ